MSLLTLRNISRSAASCGTRCQNSQPLQAVLLSSTAERLVPSTRKRTCAVKKKSMTVGLPSLWEAQPRKRDRRHGAMFLHVVWKSHTCRCLPLDSHLAAQDCVCSITAARLIAATPRALLPRVGHEGISLMRKSSWSQHLVSGLRRNEQKHLSTEDGAALLRKTLMKGVTVLGALFAVGVDSIILCLPLSVSLCCDVFHMSALQMCFSTRSWDTTLLLFE